MKYNIHQFMQEVGIAHYKIENDDGEEILKYNMGGLDISVNIDNLKGDSDFKKRVRYAYLSSLKREIRETKVYLKTLRQIKAMNFHKNPSEKRKP